MSESAAAALGDTARRAFDLRVRPTEARIDAHALMHNLREARQAAPRSRVMAVVKADGYGHGAAIAAKAFLQAGADWLGVALVEEGLALRARGAVADAHLKLDTGMGRIGALPEELPGLIAHLRGRPEVRITGLCSHFANADLRDPTSTRLAMELFVEGRRALLDAGQPLQLSHLANSAATIDLPSSHHDMVRPGLMLYGAVPAPRFAGLADLKPAMSWVTGISHLKRVPAGTPISYGHRWTARRDSVIATLPVGYADGYRRSLTNKTEVLLGGRRVKQVGTVCMDMVMIDATDVPGARVGDEVVLLGEQGGERITAQDLSDLCDTIPYELFCAIGARVPRVTI